MPLRLWCNDYSKIITIINIGAVVTLIGPSRDNLILKYNDYSKIKTSCDMSVIRQLCKRLFI